jgi:hypothetical protein
VRDRKNIFKRKDYQLKKNILLGSQFVIWQNLWVYKPKLHLKSFFMKRFIFLIAITSLLLSCSSSNNSTSSNAAYDAPGSIKAVFNSQYPKAYHASWSAYDANSPTILDWELADWPQLRTNDYTVRFSLDTFNYYAWYNTDGDWIGSAYTIKSPNALPDAVNNTVKAQFSAYSFDGAVREFWQDKEAYEIKLKNGEANKIKLLIDANGNILKQKV